MATELGQVQESHTQSEALAECYWYLDSWPRDSMIGNENTEKCDIPIEVNRVWCPRDYTASREPSSRG